jgi:cell shape-determining protein MreD
LLLCLAVVFEKSWIFAIAFFTGLFLDIFLVRTLGQTSLFFLIYLVIILLYESKFEIKTKPFIFFASFLGSLLYLLINNNSYIFAQAAVSALMAVLLFKALSIINSRSIN